ncbi:MAG TPA: type 4a pilus biogenesis protein PilO [Actinomycetota bacterium]|nr:type 4a pilus biogenesis protein PilO [Actinomycetota bacterium]
MGSRRAPLLAAIGVVALALLMFVFLVLPKMGEVTEAQDELSVAEGREQTLLAQRQALEVAEAEAPENEATIAEVQSAIPEVADEAGLMILLQNAADTAGLEVSQFSISEPVFNPESGLSAMTISVSAEGTYFQIADFLYNIETLPRAAKVLNTDLSPSTASTTGSPTLALGATMEAYTSDANPDLPGPQTESASGEEDE